MIGQEYKNTVCESCDSQNDKIRAKYLFSNSRELENSKNLSISWFLKM